MILSTQRIRTKNIQYNPEFRWSITIDFNWKNFVLVLERLIYDLKQTAHTLLKEQR